MRDDKVLSLPLPLHVISRWQRVLSNLSKREPNFLGVTIGPLVFLAKTPTSCDYRMTASLRNV